YPVLRLTPYIAHSSVTDSTSRRKSAMNCVRWSMGDAALHGIGTSLVPCQCFGCHPCHRTKLLPMSLDRTRGNLTSRCSGPDLASLAGPLRVNGTWTGLD